LAVKNSFPEPKPPGTAPNAKDGAVTRCDSGGFGFDPILSKMKKVITFYI
jgi:hypothetical protein